MILARTVFFKKLVDWEDVSSYADALKSFIDSNSATYTKSTNVSHSISLDQLVEAFIAQHGNEYDYKKLSESDTVETIKVDNDNEITINKGSISVKGLEIVDATPERIAQGAIDVSNNFSVMSSGVTDIKSYYHAEYNLFGMELWRITQEAQFTYTGSSVTVNYSKGHYTHGTLSAWQVSNWKDSSVDSIQVGGVWTKKVTSSGNFHWGIEYDGNGVVFQDLFVSIDARCTVDGVTSSYYTIE
jgi:hypothetical protein